MADDKVRYVLDVDDKGSPKLVKFGTVADASGKKAAKSFKGASDAIGEVGQRIPGVGAAMDVMSKGPLVGAGIAVAGLAAGFGAMVMHSIDTADNLNDLSLRLDITTERLSVLSLYAEQSGTDINTLAGAMGKLGNKIASGDKDLKRYGVTAGTTDEALFQLADKIAATEDPMLRLKIATDAFGKSGQEMLPLLVQGGAALREMSTQAPIVSTEMARMADDFNDRMAELKGVATKAGLDMADAFLPALIRATEIASQMAIALGGGAKASQMGADNWAKEAARLQEEISRPSVAYSDAEKNALKAELNNALILARNFQQSAIEQSIGAAAGGSMRGYRGEMLTPKAPEKERKSEDQIQKEKDAAKKAQKEVADAIAKGRKEIDEAGFKEYEKEIQARFNLQKQYEAQALAGEEERSKEALRINALEIQTKANLQRKYEDQKNAEAAASFQLQMSYANQMEGVLSSAFYNSMVNGENLWKSLGEGFANMLAQMAAQMAARAAIFGLFNAFTGGGFGLAAGGFSSFVFRAGGGPYSQGDRLITQERRAEAIIPRGPGRVAPTSKGGDTITIVVQNPTQAVSVRRQLTKSDRRRDTGIR